MRQLMSLRVKLLPSNESSNKIIWDRSVVDNIAYAKLFNLNTKAAENAAKIYRYNSKVFFLPAWESIYINDEERKMSFSDAKLFGENVKALYIQLGYTLIEVPCQNPSMRAKFIIDKLN